MMLYKEILNQFSSEIQMKSSVCCPCIPDRNLILLLLLLLFCSSSSSPELYRLFHNRISKTVLDNRRESNLVARFLSLASRQNPGCGWPRSPANLGLARIYLMGGLVVYKIVAAVRNTQNTLESLQAREALLWSYLNKFMAKVFHMTHVRST